MKRPITPRACLGCGALVKRERSLPLCRADADRAHRIFRAAVLANPPENYQRAWNLYYGSAETVAAALAGA